MNARKITYWISTALVAAVLTMQFAIHGAEVQVPSLKAMTVADARSVTAGLGLKLNVDNRYYSADVAPGHILTQSPAPGTVVRREWQVRAAEGERGMAVACYGVRPRVQEDYEGGRRAPLHCRVMIRTRFRRAYPATTPRST